MLSPVLEDMRPESELLFLAPRATLRPSEAARMRTLVEGCLDWRFFCEQASRHGVLALVLAGLKREKCLDLVPQAARQALELAVRENAARSLALTGELLRILRTFTAEDIPAVPCKGPALGVAAYGDFSHRTYCDLDILVPEELLPRARDVMSTMGYRTRTPMSRDQERNYLKTECALQLHNQKHGYIVELHWRFSERNASIALPVNAFRKRCSSLSIAGMTVPTLSREDLLLYLSVHGAKHRWERLEWINCFAELIRRNPDMDWDALEERARRHRVVRLLYLGLRLANGLLGAELPAAIERRVEAEEAANALAHWVAEGLFAPPVDETHYQQRARQYWFMLRSRERWIDRFRIVLHSAIRPPHPDASEWINLPPQLAFLHHVFRPVRLLSEYSAVAWKHYLR
jgi:hypothetical protein